MLVIDHGHETLGSAISGNHPEASGDSASHHGFSVPSSHFTDRQTEDEFGGISCSGQLPNQRERMGLRHIRLHTYACCGKATRGTTPDRSHPKGFHPSSDSPCIGDPGVLAERIEQHDHDRPALDQRLHDETLACHARIAGLLHRDIPVSL